MCHSCDRIGRNAHPDVRILDEQGGSIKIGQIREIQRDLALSPFEGRWKVHVLCDFQNATIEASNCLLKTLEEPPRRAVIILTASDSDSLLPTIVSRCQVFPLRPLPLAQTERSLEEDWGVEPAQAQLLSRLSEGRIGWAIEAASNDSLLRGREKYLLAMEQAMQHGIVGRMGLAHQLGQNSQAVPEMLELWRGWWRDMLMAKSGNGHLISCVDRQETIRAEAQHHTLHEVCGFLRSIQNAADQVNQNVSPVLVLEVLLLGLPRPLIRTI